MKYVTKDWINQFVGEASPEGDFADDVINDNTFPYNSQPVEVVSYLKDRGADRYVIRVFKKMVRLSGGLVYLKLSS